MNFTLNGLPGLLGIPWLFGVFFALQFIVILVLAFAVENDARRVERRSGQSLFLVGPWTWFFIVLFAGGYLPSLAYWLIHYSSLRFRREEKG